MVQAADAQAEAERLRDSLVSDLVESGMIVSPEVCQAFLEVPRHLFAPEVSLEAAYANDVVRTKKDERGVTISSVSAPGLQAQMLEQAQIRPGMRVLEVGSGGYNAALMAELVGADGEVTTVDIDAEITARARRCLDTAGYQCVEVVQVDAEAGVPGGRLYDRIVVTVGMWDIPARLVEQLSDSGRIVVPLRLRGLRRSVCFTRQAGMLVSTSHTPAGFVDVQGDGARPERLVTLYETAVGLKLDSDLQVDAAGLRAAIRQSRMSSWSGVRIGHGESFDGLLLWLATMLDDVALMTRDRSTDAIQVADPASRLGTPTLVERGSLAYLAYRHVGGDDYEFGAYGHGERGAKLAEQICAQLQVWDRRHRGTQALITVLPSETPDPLVPQGRVERKKHNIFVISWPEMNGNNS